MKSFAVIALLACFLGVLITTVASDEKTENQEDETKLPAPEEAVENDEVDEEGEEEEIEVADNEGNDPERKHIYF